MKKNVLFLLTFSALIVVLIQSVPYIRAGASASKAQSGTTERPARLSDHISVRAAGRGNPWINLQDGRGLESEHTGPAELQQLAEQHQTEPLALASADFDEDGTPDLITSRRAAQGGILTFYRGNPDAVYPNSAKAKERKAAGSFTDAPFLSPGRLLAVAESPDFLGAGDFDADGHWDIVTASRGDSSIRVISGDGQGGFPLSKQIEVPGRVTAMVAGEINRADGLADIVVGVAAEKGARALVFESIRGAVKADPESFALPFEASDFALGDFVDSFETDLAIVAGGELFMLQGRDRHVSSGRAVSKKKSRARIARRQLSFAVESIATGNFTGNNRFELGLLSSGGEVHALTPGKLKSKAGRKKSLDRWKVEKLSNQRWPEATRLTRARVSSIPVDNLLVIDPSAGKMHIVTGGEKARDVRLEAVSMDVEGEPVALLAMRLNPDALTDLVILSKGQAAPTLVTTAPSTVFSVTDTGDSGTGTLRQAITDANNAAGADQIIFMAGSGPQTITISGPLPSIDEAVTLDAATQPGFVDMPVIEIDGNGLENDGLSITGGSTVVRGFAINDFSGNGIRIDLNGGNIIEGNFIGLDLGGMGGPGIGGDGVFSLAINNTIGGTSSSARNVISLTGGAGASILDGDMVMGNFIGTDVTGSTALGGLGNGVTANATGAVIGGAQAGAGNVISGMAFGIFVGGDLSGVTIQGNLIGTDVTGTVGLGNQISGVLLDFGAVATTVGGPASARNIISDNGGEGIIAFPGADLTMILNNLIGTQADGMSPLGNGALGVLITPSGRYLIGDPGMGNVIAFNGADGVQIASFSSRGAERVLGSTGSTVRGNSIFANSGLGINLDLDGVTPNDAGDGDAGPNELQNFPDLTTASVSMGSVTVQGSLDSSPMTSFTIDFYASSSCDNSGNGEGERHIGSTVVMTPAVGPAPINVTFPASVSAGEVITATATGPSDNTSEFSACVTVVVGGGCVTFDNDAGDGLWQNAENWSFNTLPGPGDNACIPSQFTVTLSSGVQNIAGLMNDGTLIISGGDLIISGASTSNSLTINSPSQLSTGGTFSVTGDFNVSGGRTAGAGSLSIAQGAVLNVSGGAAFDGLTIDNAGTANWTGTASIELNNGAAFNNLTGGLFDAQATDVDFFSTSGSGSFNNAGEFRKSRSAGSVNFAGGVPFNNAGLINILSGTLGFGGGYTQTSGNLFLNGGDIISDGDLIIQGGMISGSGTINGGVVSGGQVSPGSSPGIINILGDYTQTQAGVLDLEIGGLTVGSQYDQLNVSGNVTLDGTLNILLINSFSPNIGDMFQVLTYASRTGSFATINGLNIGLGKSFQPIFNANDLTLATVAGAACTLTCPQDITVNVSPAQCGAAVSYTPPPGSQACGNVTCSPPPGAFFPLGVTTVTCTAQAGADCSFNVTVIDNEPPRITCPGNITASTTTGSAVVDYVLASATDNCSGASVICIPPSGTVFPLGANTVNCSATDPAGNTSTCSFIIAVNDGTAPMINCPPGVVVDAAAGQCSAIVNYPPPVVTGGGPTAPVVCAPPAGSTFPVGATSVFCTATNRPGNPATCSFSVTVNAPPLVRVTLEGGGATLQPGPVDPPLRPRNNPPPGCDCDRTFTIENTGCSPFALTLSEIARTGADVSGGRITNTNDSAFFSVRLVAQDQSETQLNIGSQVSFDPGQLRTFRLIFNPVIPAFTGRTSNLSASDALPHPVTSRIVFNQGGASPLNIVVPISGRVSTDVRMLNPENSRDSKRVIFTRSGDEFTISLAVFDANLDVNRIRYEFLDGQGQLVEQAFDIDITGAVSQSNIIRGQSFRVVQRFAGASGHPEISSVRVTVSDAGASDTFTAQLQSGATNGVTIRSALGEGTIFMRPLALGRASRR